MKLVQNIKVKVGEYTKNGETKGKYVTAGKVLMGDDGKKMVLMDRTFNPAGVPSDGRESIILNFWDVEEAPAKPAQDSSSDYAKATGRAPAPLDDEINF